MKVFDFRQSNSGGMWDFRSPLVIFVQAKTPYEANQRVLDANLGVYFDSSRDCDCCGPRWREQWRFDTPEPLTDVMSYCFDAYSAKEWVGRGPAVVLVLKDGTVLHLSGGE